MRACGEGSACVSGPLGFSGLELELVGFLFMARRG